MKRWVSAVAVLLALGTQAAAAPAPPAADAANHPKRIMSLKLCTDELLMDLVPAERIASISYLSREKAALRLWPQAAHIPVNHNSAEEVLAVHPDLILTDAYQSPGLRALLAKSGARIVEVPDAEIFDQIRAVTRLVGDAVDARPRAERLIAKMDATLRELAATRPAHAVRVAGWGGGGYVPGRASLFNAVLEAAGGSNIAGPDGGYYDVESLITAKPDVLAYGDDYVDTPSLRRDQDAHPALLKLFANRRIVYPSALYGCGLPESAEAARDLRGLLMRAVKTP